jgi:hypothetical protein
MTRHLSPIVMARLDRTIGTNAISRQVMCSNRAMTGEGQVVP